MAATLAGHVRMIVAQSAAGGATEHAVGPQLAAVLADRREQFPAMAAAMDSLAERGGQDQALAFGLDRILDGVQLHIGGPG